MFVKICGVTNEEDALLAVAMGADAVGFIFAPSTRQIAATQARDIARRLPPEVMTVGVFRNEAPQRVVEIIHGAGLHAVQLHGHETPAEGRWIRQRVQFLIQAFSAGDRMLERIDDYVAADAVLIDAAVPGSGQTFDWSLARDLPGERRIIVAGGLTPDNVGAAIGQVRPWGVDVSSGVERSPGRKDAPKVRRFINAAREAAEHVGVGDDPELDLDADIEMDLGLVDEPARSGGVHLSAVPAWVDKAAGASLYDWDDDTSAT